MKQRLVLTCFFALLVAFLAGLFILAQLTSLSGNPVSDQQQNSIWIGNIIIHTLLIVVLTLSLWFGVFTVRYFGQHLHIVRRNLGVRLGATLLILVFLIILGTQRGAQLIDAVMTWLSLGVLAFAIYAEGRALVRLYWNK